jgi:hypothetical protein
MLTIRRNTKIRSGTGFESGNEKQPQASEINILKALYLIRWDLVNQNWEFQGVVIY